MNGTLLLGGALALFAAGPAVAAGAAAPAAAAPPAAQVGASTASAATIATVYTADKVRDPFIKSAAPAPAAATAAALALAKGELPEAPEFSIHALSLRAIMQDSGADYALFSDANSGGTMLFRKGRLYDSKNKVIAGVTGNIKIKQKTVNLLTEDQDVQVFRLGEDRDKKEEGGPPGGASGASAAPAKPAGAAPAVRE